MSVLLFVPESSAAVPIDWGKVPEKSKEIFLRSYCVEYVEITDEETTIETIKKPLPQTFGGLAEHFHGTKIFGYMKPELCQLLLDISEFGLKHEKSNEQGLPVGPRFYMKLGNELWFLLFSPGDKEGVAHGFTTVKFPPPDVRFENLKAEYAAEAEKYREVAENFDKKLVDEVRRMSIIGVISKNRLAGWEAFTMERRLQEAQLENPIFTLHDDHPSFIARRRKIHESLSRRSS